MTCLQDVSGRAHFRVTLVPDKVEPETSPSARLEQVQNLRIREQMMIRQALNVESELEAAPEDEINNGGETAASSSRFADAESE